jgi:hypothetical protein
VLLRAGRAFGRISLLVFGPWPEGAAMFGLRAARRNPRDDERGLTHAGEPCLIRAGESAG